MPKSYEIEATVNNSNLDFTSAHETGKRKKPKRKLTAEQKERYIYYFTLRYPCIKKIKFGENANRAITARANYRYDGNNRTFIVHAYTYESLVLAMKYVFDKREVQSAL